MKTVQIGILVALVVVAALLFMVWKGQQPQTTATEETAPTAETATAAVTEPPPEPEQPDPVEAVAPKRSPSRRSKIPSKRATTTSKAEPGSTVETRLPEPATTPTAPVTPVVRKPKAAPPEPTIESPAVRKPQKVTIEAGTLLSVRLSETLASDRMEMGDSFLATLDRPLVVEGLVIAERGARFEGRIVELEKAGRVKGVSSLGIQLVRLHTSDGQRVDIQTETFRKRGPTTKKEDAAKVGAGAGLGAAIGAIAGGGKGAAIGAAIGGAAGAGGVAATRGKPTVLPVETRIDFRLNAPITLTELIN